MARGGGSDQRKAGAVRRPKPKDHGGIGMTNDGALNVVATGDLAGPSVTARNASSRNCCGGSRAEKKHRGGI